MGDLDEAIREHLDLKRRRGADPAEVAREEEEALSPVTRSHPVVTTGPAPPVTSSDDEHGEQAREGEPVAAHNGAPANDPVRAPVAPAAAPDAGPDVEDDATQEFHV